MSASFLPSREMIDPVAEWHQRQSEDRIRRPLGPALKQRFNLDNLQAVAVIQAAQKGGRDAASQ